MVQFCDTPRIALTWVPVRSRRRGRPRETWRRTAEKDLKERGLKTWAEAAIAATNRVDWKQRACSPIL